MKEELEKLKENIFISARGVSQSEEQTIGEKRDLYITLEQLEKILTESCTHDCSWDAHYGFVPEAGCPIHDNDV